MRITNQQYIEAARKVHSAILSEGSVEIDDSAKVSRSEDNGAYIETWVWVYDSDVPGHD